VATSQKCPRLKALGMVAPIATYSLQLKGLKPYKAMND